MPWNPPRNDRGKALALVAGLHVLLGAGLISGLAGEPLEEMTERIEALDLTLPEQPPKPEPPPPPPDESEAAPEEEAGAVDLEAKPAPVVLPPPPQPLPTRNPLPTADEAAPDTGRDPSAGAGSEAGPGRGAGGEGDGTGGGGTGGTGTGSGSGLGSEARLLSGNLTRSDYRRIRNFGSPRGQAVLAIEVGPTGRLTRCRALSGSGSAALDEELCRLLGRTRWEPARDRSGRPVPVSLRYVATWDRD
jgi:periplasmic protein TonB